MALTHEDSHANGFDPYCGFDPLGSVVNSVQKSWPFEWNKEHNVIHRKLADCDVEGYPTGDGDSEGVRDLIRHHSDEGWTLCEDCCEGFME